ncbi:EF-P 5-aminopentanol modification-associated protein YfmF [Streptococcus dysgalactiae subsp. equisimilis]|uniref:EF-P 5-aminopentanol modification-associated protein YfmF n=1 Tax=Streptococcus dysgalactiae TaxID=1334 RepID=UPI0006504F65|nr:pitrilysin family protein [Streptococcus dysgalactiae]MBM6514785.1 insulinase family protein [Streptococcus dysgalactiae subsp. equisimilis]MBM6534176.1 insulinase family protein [Streptococcus dysgalactiae subsp. equisimilis]MBM6548751.1 insulinase family protein [Streptococcus dysgalactiae subsp. equisimilis]MCY7233969.1 insulinase family protein [Streptococcus dysgalactiae]OBZ04461.1 peptidase M16 [Streptococcus dysgalactiae subsp. equisimilis]
MKIVQGVQLHLIKTKRFKTNHITFRFSGDLNQKTVAKRVLVAQMLATANDRYPTAKLFREKLTELYGANLSTNVSTKGLVHIVDIDITFVQDRYAFQGEKVLDEMIQFLKEILFSPLLSIAQYQPKVFDIEKSNLINYVESDKEDSFYYSSLKTKELFYLNKELQVSKYGTAELITKETAYTSYQEFHKMLNEDQIDIFVLGDFDDYRVVQLLHQFPFDARKKKLDFFYLQDAVNIIKESIEKKDINQSILQLAYHFPLVFGQREYYALVVLNGLLGSFAHSRFFTKIREEEGLAYSIGCRFDVYTGLFDVYAGIDSQNRTKTLQLIVKELNDIKMGRFSGQLMKKTKLMLINNALLSEDYSKNMIEMTYMASYIDPSYSIKHWIDEIDKVSKVDIIKVANLLKLQTVYFLEGK